MTNPISKSATRHQPERLRSSGEDIGVRLASAEGGDGGGEGGGLIVVGEQAEEGRFRHSGSPSFSITTETQRHRDLKKFGLGGSVSLWCNHTMLTTETQRHRDLKKFGLCVSVSLW